jgi:hypothetical protein
MRLHFLNLFFGNPTQSFDGVLELARTLRGRSAFDSNRSALTISTGWDNTQLA